METSLLTTLRILKIKQRIMEEFRFKDAYNKIDSMRFYFKRHEVILLEHYIDDVENLMNRLEKEINGEQKQRTTAEKDI